AAGQAGARAVGQAGRGPGGSAGEEPPPRAAQCPHDPGKGSGPSGEGARRPLRPPGGRNQ
ncbi:unnamed protein product, partial [Prorocentrum cordatum]